MLTYLCIVVNIYPCYNCFVEFECHLQCKYTHSVSIHLSFIHCFYFSDRFGWFGMTASTQIKDPVLNTIGVVVAVSRYMYLKIAN